MLKFLTHKDGSARRDVPGTERAASWTPPSCWAALHSPQRWRVQPAQIKVPKRQLREFKGKDGLR